VVPAFDAIDVLEGNVKECSDLVAYFVERKLARINYPSRD
jgi:hypothetical protein